MKRQYRLTPKPGVARAGRRVNTNVKPIIVAGQPNVVKTRDPKVVKEQAVKRVIIKKPDKRRVVRPRTPRSNRARAPRPSPLRQQKELEIGRYKEAVNKLKNCGVGRILIMVACGPSITEADLPKMKDHPLIDFMSINKPDPRLHPTQYWVFCDQSQYTRNKDTFEKYTGNLINAWSVRARHKNQTLIRNKSGKGFSKNLSQGYHIGRSTTFANMQTAFWMNYDKVYIFGCDMCKPPGQDKLHFYGVNKDVEPSIRAKRFAKEAEHYMIGAKQLTAEERKKFVFCSSYNPWPFVKEFEKMDHKKAVDHILEKANEMLKQK
jgi:hypothetical protein